MAAKKIIGRLKQSVPTLQTALCGAFLENLPVSWANSKSTKPTRRLREFRRTVPSERYIHGRAARPPASASRPLKRPLPMASVWNCAAASSARTSLTRDSAARAPEPHRAARTATGGHGTPTAPKYLPEDRRRSSVHPCWLAKLRAGATDAASPSWRQQKAGGGLSTAPRPRRCIGLGPGVLT